MTRDMISRRGGAARSSGHRPRPSSDRIPELLETLASGEARATRSAGDALVILGDEAVEPLINALRTGSPALRRPAAFLLGRFPPDRRLTSALVHALVQEEPKVRKNAAIALGRVGNPECVRALGDALEREEVLWVRPSILLAIGALAGPAAASTLATIEPRSPAEREALRKALDRSVRVTPLVRWTDRAAAAAPVYATAPGDLEDIAAQEALSMGLAATVVCPGLLRIDHGDPRSLLSRLRSIYAVRLLFGQAPPVVAVPLDRLPEALGDLLRQSRLSEWPNSFHAADGSLRYRLFLEGATLRKDIVRQIVSQVRAAVEPLGLRDSPSHYSVQLVLKLSANATSVWLVPVFQEDTRFAYRRADVGAAIHPVVAACLARLVRHAGSGTVLDPTCGSGTLLIERALLDAGVRLHGVDISPTAVAAAATNVDTAGVTGRFVIRRGDAARADCWVPCSEAIMNLPFGVRSRSQDRDLPRTYAGVVTNLARFLIPGGRAVIYTANAQLLRPALAAARAHLETVEERAIEVGGLIMRAWVLRSTSRICASVST